MSLETPKRGTPAFERLRDRLRTLFDPSKLHTVAYGAFDRSRAELILEAKESGDLTRADLISGVVDAFFTDDERAFHIVRELDRVTRSARSMVESVDAELVAEKLGDHPTLRLRRQGAALLWAIARDGRPGVSDLLAAALQRYSEHTRELNEARATVRAKGAGEALDTYTSVYDDTADEMVRLEAQVNESERKRAQLVAEIGRREAALSAERARRKELKQELEKIRDQGAPAVEAPKPDVSAEGLQKRIRKLEKRLAAVEHERDVAQEDAQRARQLEEDNARLRRTMDRLRELRARERKKPPADPPEGAGGDAAKPVDRVQTNPAVESPKRRRARRDDARVAVLVDVANLAGAARRIHSRGVDFRATLATLVGGRRLVEARAYAIDNGKPGFERFSGALRNVGFKVFPKRPKTFADGTVKADWDVGIAVDAMGIHSRVDVVVLATGDGDFLPLVRALKAQGVQVEAAAFEERTAGELVQAADRFVELDENSLE